MDHKEVEKRIIKKIKLLLSSFEAQFLTNEITYEIQLKENYDDGFENYDSEIEIVFNKGVSFLDIIEFFIYRNGELFIEEEKLIKELYSDLEEIIFSTR